MDGHGHDYHRSLAYGAAGGRQSVVVLLCAKHEPHRQTNGWEQAVVVTYAEPLEDLQAHIAGAARWRGAHPQQHFLINQLIEHFVQGSGAVNIEDRIAFLTTMCETGESVRYGHRPQEVAAQVFAELEAQHSRRQFEEGRQTLAQVKRSLKRFAQQTLVGQVNDGRAAAPVRGGPLGRVSQPFRGLVGRLGGCRVLVCCLMPSGRGSNR